MLFKNKKCSKCGRHYEEILDKCPSCGTANKDYKELGIPRQLVMLPYLNQIGLFVIGLIGLVLLQVLFGVIFQSTIGDSNESLTLLLTNILPYSTIVLALLASLFFFKDKILQNFKKPYDFLIGLAFGGLIIGFSFLYTNVFLDLFDIGINTNQTTFESFVSDYPIACILIFGLIAPVVEELTYRLGLFSITYRINKVAAYIVVAVIFGLIHFDFFGDVATEFLNLPNYCIAGVLFCLAYRFGGLPGCITAHAFNNVFSIIYTIISLKYAK